MEPVTDVEVRRSLINVTRGEAKALTMPPDLDRMDWPNLEFLGWRDPKAPLRGFLIRWRADQPVGIMLRAAQTTVSRRVKAVCMLCRSGRSGSDISLFTARRVGPAGRNGDTVGTYICADLACCGNVRTVKVTPELQPDPGLTTDQRIANLCTRVDGFLDEVRKIT